MIKRAAEFRAGDWICPPPCSEPDCARLAVRGGITGRCTQHGGGKRCQELGCDKGAKVGGRCGAHGGGMRCQELGCDKGAQRGGRCRAHGGGPRCQELGCDKGALGGGR